MSAFQNSPSAAQVVINESMRFYTKNGKRRPITPRRFGYSFRLPRPSSSLSIRRNYPHLRFPEPLPENLIRPAFNLSEGTRNKVTKDILSYVAQRASDDVAKALASEIAKLVPSALGVNVQHVIKIEQQKNGVKGYVGISIPINLATVPGGAVTQLIAGTPTFYANIQCKVRLYKRKSIVQTTQVAVGYSQKPAWTDQGVEVEWHKSFKPIVANVTP